MKTRIHLFGILFLALSFIFSCKKESNGGGQNTPTEVVIQLPTAGQIVINGSNLKVEGTASDNNVLANVSVQVRNKASGVVLHAANVTTASVTFYRYLFNWTVTGITTTTIATVKVTGKDVGGGEAFKEVDITLEP